MHINGIKHKWANDSSTTKPHPWCRISTAALTLKSPSEAQPEMWSQPWREEAKTESNHHRILRIFHPNYCPPTCLLVFYLMRTSTQSQWLAIAMESRVLTYEGCNFFRQRLVLATLSSRPVRIKGIREHAEEPGLRGLYYTVATVRICTQVVSMTIDNI